MKHFTIDNLKQYLSDKNISKTRDSDYFLSVKKHIDTCKVCWLRWNKLRWDRAKKTKGFRELRKYLGASFEWYLDSSWALAKEWKRKKPQKIKDIENFYRETKYYLYNLTIWHESEDRYPYFKDFNKINKKYNIRSFLDYGCGIGSDGLKVLEKGKIVYFYDFKSPSTDFLKWRAKKREKKINLIYVSPKTTLPDADMVWSIDVLEHMVNPLEILKAITKRTRFFVHESAFGEKSEGRHPFHFDFNINILNRELSKKGFSLRNEFLNLNFWIRK